MSDRYRLMVSGASHMVQRHVEGAWLIVGYLDGRYATEIVDTLNGVPIRDLQKQVAIVSDGVEDILRRVIRLGKGVTE